MRAKVKYSIALLVFFIMLSENSILSQKKIGFLDRLFEGTYIGMNAGPTLFYGDINQTNNMDYAYTYTTEKEISAMFKLRGQASVGKIVGKNNGSFHYFENQYFQYSAGLSLNYSNWWFGYDNDRRISLYSIGTVGLMHYRVLTKDARKNNEVIFARGYKQEDDGEYVKDKMSIEGMVSLGGGIDFRLNKNWIFFFETTLNYVNYDGLDGRISDPLDDGKIIANPDIFFTNAIGIKLQLADRDWKKYVKYNRSSFFKPKKRNSTPKYKRRRIKIW